jgi:hypothetical protein
MFLASEKEHHDATDSPHPRRQRPLRARHGGSLLERRLARPLFDRATDRLPEAAMGVDVIVNGWNPTYDRWADLLPGLTDTVIKAARVSGATVIQAANVYVYGEGSPETLGPDTPHAAKNPLGRLRVEMEDRLRAAGIPLILLRAGDFIDTKPRATGSTRCCWRISRRAVWTIPATPTSRTPGRISPTWAAPPWRSPSAVQSLRAGRRGPVPGYTLSGRDLTCIVAEASARPVRLARFAWWPLHLARPFWRLAGRASSRCDTCGTCPMRSTARASPNRSWLPTDAGGGGDGAGARGLRRADRAASVSPAAFP